MPIIVGLRAILPTVGFIIGGQALCAAFAVPYKTEKYYDLAGSAGFVTAIGFSLFQPYLSARFQGVTTAPFPKFSTFHPRQLIASALVLTWSLRLGSFLFQRIQKSGKDGRFDEIKQNPAKFFGAWMMQAAWISLTAMPVFLLNALPARAHPALGLLDYAALTLWATGFGLEVVADRQKAAWREAKNNKEHDQGFPRDGVWSISRHPNYAGEVTLWSAQFLLAVTALTSPAGKLVLGPYALPLAAASPVLEYGLIRYISGVPMLEKSMDEKLKDDPEWKKYKNTTPVFFPFIGSRKA